MTTPTTPDTTLTPEAQATRLRIQGATLIVAAIVAFGIVWAVMGSISLVPILFGALGWFIALVLRQPVALLASKKLGQEKAAAIVGWFSGPAEELVRLALVLLTIHAFAEATWFGLGWGALEAAFVGINIIAAAAIFTKDDPKSLEARELLAAQGMLDVSTPGLAFLERMSATAMHMGFTFLLFANPWFVLLTLPLHSLINMIMVRFATKHLLATELVFAAISAVTLVASILLLV